MLIDETLYGTVNKVEQAIERIREHEPPDGYYVAFSGGKDSVVVLDLVKRAGVKYEAHYHLTTVDPPELVYFIRDNYPDVERDLPKETMWQLIERKLLPPTRLVRYCCEILKEYGGEGRTVITGVRARESSRRAKRSMFEEQKRKRSLGGKYLHPIFDWMEEDVWEYIRKYSVPYCTLYDEGFTRIGCVMCPMQGFDKMKRDMERWPKIAECYHMACIRCYDKTIADGKLYNSDIKSGEDIWKWWLGELKKAKHDDISECYSLFREIPDTEMTTSEITYT